MKKSCVLAIGVLFLSSLSYAENIIVHFDKDNNSEKSSKYDYIYQNPPRQSLMTNGLYVVSTSGVRYVHSPSKLKRAAHAARINAYNYQYGNY